MHRRRRWLFGSNAYCPRRDRWRRSLRNEIHRDLGRTRCDARRQCADRRRAPQAARHFAFGAGDKEQDDAVSHLVAPVEWFDEAVSGFDAMPECVETGWHVDFLPDRFERAGGAEEHDGADALHAGLGPDCDADVAACPRRPFCDERQEY